MPRSVMPRNFNARNASRNGKKGRSRKSKRKQQQNDRDKSKKCKQSKLGYALLHQSLNRVRRHRFKIFKHHGIITAVSLLHHQQITHHRPEGCDHLWDRPAEWRRGDRRQWAHQDRLLQIWVHLDHHLQAWDHRVVLQHQDR